MPPRAASRPTSNEKQYGRLSPETIKAVDYLLNQEHKFNRAWRSLAVTGKLCPVDGVKVITGLGGGGDGGGSPYDEYDEERGRDGSFETGERNRDD